MSSENLKISCLSIDCPERNGGLCQYDPRRAKQSIWDILDAKHVKDGRIKVTEEELQQYIDTLGGGKFVGRALYRGNELVPA